MNPPKPAPRSVFFKRHNIKARPQRHVVLPAEPSAAVPAAAAGEFVAADQELKRRRTRRRRVGWMGGLWSVPTSEGRARRKYRN